MKLSTPVLSITGSDNTGGAGIQADIRTISALGGLALTAVTTVTVQDDTGIQALTDLPREMIVGQVKAIVEGYHPRVVKVGLLRDADTVYALEDEIVGCPTKILVPGILASHGRRLMGTEAIEAWKRRLIPEATLLITRCSEAQLLLGRTIATDDDMLSAAHALMDIGAEAVMMRGGHQVEGRLTALLATPTGHRFFSSRNTEGWQRHGVGGALSSAIATRMALGDDIPTAIALAHDYMHSQVVYAVEPQARSYRQADLYNQLMALVADHYREAHDVAFYADRLAITPRYLARVTEAIVQKTPKQVIADYIIKEATTLLSTSRLTIGEIATKLGYSSLPMFSKVFSQHEGCSPVEYRNRASQL